MSHSSSCKSANRFGDGFDCICGYDECAQERKETSHPLSNIALDADELQAIIDESRDELKRVTMRLEKLEKAANEYIRLSNGISQTALRMASEDIVELDDKK